jgi:hypothetical protein
LGDAFSIALPDAAKAAAAKAPAEALFSIALPDAAGAAAKALFSTALPDAAMEAVVALMDKIALADA